MELHVRKLILENGETWYAIFEQGKLSTPLALITQYEFKRFVERCQEAGKKPISRKKK